MKTHLFLIVFMVGLVATMNAQIPTNGLIGSWPFNGNANDESGNGYTGTVNGASLTTDRFGNSNSAYSFNGQDTYINLGNLGGYSSHTFTGWFKIEGQQESYGVLVSKLYNDLHFAKNSEIKIGHNYGDGYKISSVLGNGSEWVGNHIDIPVDSTVWHHFAYLYNDSEKSIKIFLDNEMIDSISTTGYSDVETTPTYIGARPYWNGPTVFFFNGFIDDVRIYNRALNISEISSIYYENMCFDTIINDTTLYHVLDLGFEDLSPKVYLNSIDSLNTSVGACDSIIYKYLKFVYEPNYFTDTIWVNDTIVTEVFDTTYVTITDTTFITVTDTLFIDVNITGVNPPENMNTLKVYPNPAKDYLYINTGNNYERMTEYKIKIISSSGSLIFETKVNQQLFEINVNEFGQTGLFFIQIINNTNQIIDTRKIILE